MSCSKRLKLDFNFENLKSKTLFNNDMFNIIISNLTIKDIVLSVGFVNNQCKLHYINMYN